VTSDDYRVILGYLTALPSSLKVIQGNSAEPTAVVLTF